MSSRERWIVYPLLYFSMLMGFKSSFQEQMDIRCRSIECRQLTTASINGQPASQILWPSATQMISEALRAARIAASGESSDPASDPASDPVADETPENETADADAADQSAEEPSEQ